MIRYLPPLLPGKEHRITYLYETIQLFFALFLTHFSSRQSICGHLPVKKKLKILISWQWFNN
jgi:hypothetical protein